MSITLSFQLPFQANYGKVQSAENKAMTKVTVRPEIADKQETGPATQIKAMNAEMIKKLGTHLDTKA